jgi:hypothetical protein
MEHRAQQEKLCIVLQMENLVMQQQKVAFLVGAVRHILIGMEVQHI